MIVGRDVRSEFYSGVLYGRLGNVVFVGAQVRASSWSDGGFVRFQYGFELHGRCLSFDGIAYYGLNGVFYPHFPVLATTALLGGFNMSIILPLFRLYRVGK